MFEVDVTVCVECGGPTKIISAITRPDVIEGTQLVQDTRAAPDWTGIEQAQWEVIDTDRHPFEPLPWAGSFPAVTTSLSPTGPDQPLEKARELMVVVSSGCRPG